MADNAKVVDPNDFKVVEFHNSTDFTFTPAMGCMFDGRPIFGITGAPGINAGETITLPYHVGNRLAINLAKAVLVRQAPMADQKDVPTGMPLWSTDSLEKMKSSYLVEKYSEAKPIAQTETDRLMSKIEDLNKMVMELAKQGKPSTEIPLESSEAIVEGNQSPHATAYQDKQDVIAELEKRGIKHDKRANKATLEKLLV